MSNPGLIDLYTTQFTALLHLKLQQLGSKLRGKVWEGSHQGKMASPVNQISAIQLKAPAGRFAPKARTDPTFTRRWVFPQEGEIDQLIDTYDELQTIVDPKSQYAQNAANAVGRAWDDVIIAAAFGTAQIGTDANSLSSETWGSISSSYLVAENFAASGNVGLTVAKLIEAKRIFRHSHVDLETDPAAVVIGSTQESNLLNQVQVVSTEFSDRPVLLDGRVQRFLGFDVVVSERLAVATNNRQCIAFVKSGLYLGVWKDLTNRVSIRNDLSSEPYDLFTATMYGATRIEPGRVVEVDCYDTVGADITP
ncbi:hypothetical protein UFOVP134_52 [uncultured Caudovirales phage]|uniref:Major capsid protein n=1 Tax=uncultured Caudovirales phage TaxID=2100421 RepID=A0A6J5LD73_9CAUD|nr:hypothetical protein UFOVP134_52 [uncultured Caudovirales phage]